MKPPELCRKKHTQINTQIQAHRQRKQMQGHSLDLLKKTNPKNYLRLSLLPESSPYQTLFPQSTIHLPLQSWDQVVTLHFCLGLREAARFHKESWLTVGSKATSSTLVLLVKDNRQVGRKLGKKKKRRRSGWNKRELSAALSLFVKSCTVGVTLFQRSFLFLPPPSCRTLSTLCYNKWTIQSGVTLFSAPHHASHYSGPFPAPCSQNNTEMQAFMRLLAL